MTRELQDFVRHLRRSLDPSPALALALRLLQARSLELQWDRELEELRENQREVLEPLSPGEQETFLRAQLRDRLTSFPRGTARIARLVKEHAGSAVIAPLREHLRDFAGAIGERLRDDVALAHLDALQDPPETLRKLLRIAFGDDGQRDLHRAFRLAYEQLAPARDDVQREGLEKEFQAFLTGIVPATRCRVHKVASQSLHVETDYDRRVNWAMECNGIPIVHAVRITNRGEEPRENLTLELHLGPDVSDPVTCPLGPIPPGGTYSVERPDLKLRGHRLRDVREREPATLYLEVREPDHVLVREDLPVELLAFHEWDPQALWELLASFVLPNSPAVQHVLSEARHALERATQDPSFTGYQTRSRARVRAMVEALYETLQRLDITYVNPPASFEPTGQKIRLPGEVLRYRMGTCIDLSCLFAACLEQIGLNPLVVHVEGHAFPGCWLVDDWFPQPDLDDHALLRKLIEVDEILVFDSSTVATRPARKFADAVEEAGKHLVDPIRLRHVLDVRAARLDRILPLPVIEDAAPGDGPQAPPVDAPTSSVEPSDPTSPAPASEPPPEVGTTTAVRPPERVQRWKEKLLDLTLRNQLLNYRDRRTACLPLDCPDLAELEDRLANGESFHFAPRIDLDRDDPRVRELLSTRGAEEVYEEQRRALLRRGHLLTLVGEGELQTRLVNLGRSARREIEESGTSPLYLALGMLHWAEDEAFRQDHVAPLLLVPLDFERATARSPWTIRRAEDEPRLNETLLEKLRLDFGLEFPELRELPLDDAGVDVDAVLRVFREAIARIPKWEVRKESHLAFFHFTKFLMWRDLDRHTEDLMRSDLVRRLAEGREAFAEHAFLDPRELDDTTHPASNFLVLNADSSQQLAVEEAARGSSFVLQGPPGTGKSQTIANIIARQLAEGRRVLFVAEKRAALDVVATRLRKVGLGEYCLELHSNRTRKKDVAQHLAESLERRLAASDLDPTLSESIDQDRRLLNGYVRRLHESADLGTSVFAAQARLTMLREAPLLPVRFDDVLAIDRTRRATLEDLVQRLRSAANAIGPVAEHPFAACRFPRWTPLLAREVQQALEDLQRSTSNLEEHALRAMRWLDVQELLTIDELQAAHALLRLSYDAPPATRELLEHPEIHAPLLEIVERGAEYARRLQAVGERWETSILELDLDRLIADWKRHGTRFAPLRWFFLRRHYPTLRARMRGERLPPHARILEDLGEARALNELGAKVLEREPLLRTTFEIAWDGLHGDWEALRAHVTWAGAWLRAMERLARLAPDPVARRKNPPSDLADPLGETLERVQAHLDLAILKLGIDERAAFGGDAVRATPRALREPVERWLAHLDELRAWSLYSSAEMVLEEAQLGAIAAALRRGAVAADQLPAAFERTLLEQWIDHLAGNAAELADFKGVEHSRIVERYAARDHAWIESGGRRVAARLAQDKPRPGKPSEGSEVHLLHREAKKKRGHLPIRRLLEQLPHLLPRIKPCFLMSPLSIAQYLPPSREPFDLVVFDEASQIPTHDAIGAIARGVQVIVVGDSQQLPPTTFFSITEDEDSTQDESRMQELESILDECTASQVPTLMLEWHYRSRDEALIAFSNHHYYKNRLHTFPGAFERAPHLGLEHRACEGCYERGTRVNRREAEAVVQYVVACLQDEDARRHSIGIVTFNAAQQQLIEDLLDAERQRLPEIEPFFLDVAPEPLFVKNLENVQGDERDTILFSITYAADAEGKISMNFGPLNRDGGERRLNVAITRAREKLVVFATMRSQEIDLSRTKALGAAHLKSFLRYAELGTRAFAEAQELDESWKVQQPLVEDVARALRERGHEVDACVGCSGYRIDLAIRDPQEPGRYALGLELDGVFYRSAPTARDRDRIRREVLEGLGWNLHRVWSPEWHRGRDDELARIEKALAAASRRTGYGGANAGFEPRAPVAPSESLPSEPVPIRGAAAAATPAAEAALAVDDPSPVEPRSTWEPVTFEVQGDAERFYEGQSTVTLQALLVRAVREEGPIHEEEAARRVAQAFGVPRVTERVRSRVLDLLATKRVQEAVRREGPFLWPSALDPATYEFARAPAEGAGTRKPEHVPPQELQNALALVLRASIAAPLDALLRDAARHLGYQRLTNAVREAFETAVSALCERGFCARDGDTVRLTE